MSVLLDILTVVLILVSFFLILVILMQKDKSGGGMGTAMGGGMAEATFGAETSNVLTKATVNAAVAFFVLSLALFLGRIYQRHHGVAGHALPTIAAPAPAGPSPVFPAPAMPKPTAPAPAPAKPSAPPSHGGAKP